MSGGVAGEGGRPLPLCRLEEYSREYEVLLVRRHLWRELLRRLHRSALRRLAGIRRESLPREAASLPRIHGAI